MRIIDAHVHIFPNKIAAKATNAVGEFYNLPMEGDGTLDSVLRDLDQAGIERCIAHSVATTPAQVPRINEFIMNAYIKYPDRIIPFAAMHPGVADGPAQVAEIVRMGFKGIKIHPDIQGFAIDGAESLAMIRAIEGQLPLLTHAGDPRYPYSRPAQVRRVLQACPKLTMICAHLSGWGEWENAAATMPGQNCYIDTSSSLYALPPARAAAIIRAFGVERTLFGSDYPMWHPTGELERFYRLGLTDDENEQILHRTAETLLRL